MGPVGTQGLSQSRNESTRVRFPFVDECSRVWGSDEHARVLLVGLQLLQILLHHINQRRRRRRALGQFVQNFVEWSLG